MTRSKKKKSAPKEPKPAAPLVEQDNRYLAVWLSAIALIAAVFLILKMFAMNPYAGDEHIYLYQAKLIVDGVEPYSGFSMAHPPGHALFTALVLKIFGYHFLLARLLPVFWCLLGGVLLAVLVKRELGSIASIAATGLYLLAYEPLRASSHYTGVNMSTALVVAAFLVYRLGAVRSTAAICVFAVFTRLYAAPVVLALTVFALVKDKKIGLKLIAWGASIGAGAAIALGLWTGFTAMVSNVLAYQVQKTPMGSESVDNVVNQVLFHDSCIAFLFALSLLSWFIVLCPAYSKTQGKIMERLTSAVHSEKLGLVVLCSLAALFHLTIVLNTDRIWTYYFVPAFPFAAVLAGWLVSKWITGAIHWYRDPKNKKQFTARIAGVSVAVVFAVSCWLSPRLESRLDYYKREIVKPLAERTHTYQWRPGLLPDFLNKLSKTLFWKDERIIGEPYNRFNYLLWHEAGALDVIFDMAKTIEKETAKQGKIFGDSGTVPLLALLSGRDIAGNEVDTNIQQYRSKNEDPKKLIERIDHPSTEMIVLRRNFGVAGVAEVVDLVKRKYKQVAVFRSPEKGSFYFFKRKE